MSDLLPISQTIVKPRPIITARKRPFKHLTDSALQYFIQYNDTLFRRDLCSELPDDLCNAMEKLIELAKTEKRIRLNHRTLEI